MKLDIYHIDAFASQVFQGNPAAVCILDQWLPDAIMQAIAAEMNLSETAFCVARNNEYRIRWFTPTIEVKLCGHATLAAAHVLFQHLGYQDDVIRFQSLSGPLHTAREDGAISLDLPLQPVSPLELSRDIESALGLHIKELYAGEDLVVIVSDPSEVDIYEPDINKLNTLPYRGICISAPGNGSQYDFVSRFFAPRVGINEDPVTGSSFTKLAPIYALKLGKTEFKAKQLSSRGGELSVSLKGDRVVLSGSAVTVMKAEFYLPQGLL